MQKVNAHKVQSGMNNLNLGGPVEYSAEEAKVARHGEKGQGDYLVEAQRGRKK